MKCYFLYSLVVLVIIIFLLSIKIVLPLHFNFILDICLGFDNPLAPIYILVLKFLCPKNHRILTKSFLSPEISEFRKGVGFSSPGFIGAKQVVYQSAHGYEEPPAKYNYSAFKNTRGLSAPFKS